MAPKKELVRCSSCTIDKKLDEFRRKWHGGIQGTRDGKHQLVLASLKEIKVFMACDSSHYKKQAHLTGLLLDLESTSRRLRDLTIRGALTVPWRGEGVVSGRKTEDIPATGHISVDQTLELCVLHLKKQKLKNRQGVRNWIVRRNLRLARLWGTREDSDEEFEEADASDGDIDEDHLDTTAASLAQSTKIGRGHLLYRDEKGTHKYGLDKPLFVGGVFTVMQGIDTCLPVDTAIPDGENCLRPLALGNFFAMREVAFRKFHKMKDIDHVKGWKDNITSAPEALHAHNFKKDSPEAKVHKSKHGCKIPACTEKHLDSNF